METINTTERRTDYRKNLREWFERHRAHDAYLGDNYGHCHDCQEHVVARMDTGELRHIP